MGKPDRHRVIQKLNAVCLQILMFNMFMMFVMYLDRYTATNTYKSEEMIYIDHIHWIFLFAVKEQLQKTPESCSRTCKLTLTQAH